MREQRVALRLVRRRHARSTHRRCATAIDISALRDACTPGYFNDDGDRTSRRWYLGEAYGPGWDAFQALLAGWRARGDMAGLATVPDPLAARAGG